MQIPKKLTVLFLVVTKCWQFWRIFVLGGSSNLSISKIILMEFLLPFKKKHYFKIILVAILIMEKRINTEKCWFYVYMNLLFYWKWNFFLLINTWALLGFALWNCIMMHKFLSTVKFLFSCIFQISVWRVIACDGMFIAEMQLELWQEIAQSEKLLRVDTLLELCATSHIIFFSDCGLHVTLKKGV